MTRQEALPKIVKAAVACERKTQVPAELLVAQCALESGWLAHAPGNNCFGIKFYAGAFGKQTLRTREVVVGKDVYVMADFATFPSLQACFEKRAQLFFAGRYRPFATAYKLNKDLVALVRGIAPIYATDPRYADKVLAFAQDPEIKKAIADERAAPAA